MKQDDIIIRRETPADYGAVEHLTRLSADVQREIYFCGQTRDRRSFHCGDPHFSGLDRIRTDDSHNAKQPRNFLSILGRF